MEWKDIAGMVGKAAPIVGGLIGGPAGAAVGGLVASALGTEATPDAISRALVTDPDAVVKLKELEVNSRTELQSLAVTAENNRLQAAAVQYAAEAADRDSARRLASQQTKDWVRPSVTVLLLMGGGGNRLVRFLWHGRRPTERRHGKPDHRHHHRLLVQRTEAGAGVLVRNYWRIAACERGSPAFCCYARLRNH